MRIRAYSRLNPEGSGTLPSPGCGVDHGMTPSASVAQPLSQPASSTAASSHQQRRNRRAQARSNPRSVTLVLARVSLNSRLRMGMMAAVPARGPTCG